MSIDLNAIQARTDAATEGPWANYGDFSNKVYQATGIEDEEPTLAYEIPNLSDAEFIAAARTDVPALLALVREQQARLVALEADIDGELQDAPAPNYEEDNYDAGYIAGLTYAQDKLRAALTATDLP